MTVHYSVMWMRTSRGDMVFQRDCVRAPLRKGRKQVAVATPPTFRPPQHIFKQIFSLQFIMGRSWYGLILAITH